jgi:hypothetical protein
MNMLLNFFRFKSCARFEFDTSSLPLHDNVMMVWGDDDRDGRPQSSSGTMKIMDYVF